VAEVLISGSGARCGQTNAEYACAIDAGAASPTVTVSAYLSPSAKNLRACSNILIIDAYDKDWTRFFLPTGTTSGAHIVIVDSPCQAL